MIKKIILWCLIIINASAIFIFSSQPAEISSDVSGGIVRKIIETLPGIKELPQQEKAEIYELIHTAVRKIAHFTLYTLLGIWVFLQSREYNLKNPAVFTVTVCLFYAISDELHQLFSSGRSCELRDMCIDTAGAVFGVLLVIMIEKIKNKYISCTKIR